MKTAVEWLVEQLNLHEYEDVIKQAKEMEKKQIKKAYYTGNDDVIDNPDREAEQYYNETFKSEQNGNSINKYNECLCWVYAWNMVE